MKEIFTEYAVVGSGPGGASTALELAKKGKHVVILEKGRRHPITKSKVNAYGMYDKWAVFSRSKEGVIIDRAITLGGCSVVFSGNAFDPPPWLFEPWGIHLTAYAGEISDEIGIAPFSEAFCAPWTGIRRLREAADGLGVDLKPQKKFITEALCRNGCDGCMTGCRNDAKWTARRWIDDAASLGATVITEADVSHMEIKEGRVRAVHATTPDGKLRVDCEAAVLAAGGIGTAVILQKSGIDEAGNNFFMDPMNVVWGMADEPVCSGTEMTFSYACDTWADEKGYLLGNVSGKGAWVSRLMRPLSGWPAFFHSGKWDRMMGMFIKVADDRVGTVDARGRMTKPLTDEDKKKSREATDLAIAVMTQAGVAPHSIRVVPAIGGHPGGTAAIGEVVDDDFKVRGVKNLHLCDASVFPKSPGRPPTLIILALGRHLVRNVLEP